ncbi:MAG: 3-isopropylmalate dehydrogenase [Planctomycetota bacterium]
MADLNLATIGGDGVGPEVVDQALRVLDATAPRFGLSIDRTDLPYGGARYLETGQVLTDDEVQDLKRYDAVLLGAVGRPDVPPGVLEKGLLLKLRFDLDLFINLRPGALLPGVTTPLADKQPADIDMLMVRENTESLYLGAGGRARQGTPYEVATQEMWATRFGVERCLRYAFDAAQARPRKHLTLVHKTNVLTFCGKLWFDVFQEVAGDYPDVETDYHHVDACCMYLVSSPERYDTLVTENMFGDIVTDLAAAICGGMGVAASGNLNPLADALGPSVFEPVHGSAPDIAGQDAANPLACVASLAMLLTETGRRLDKPKLVDAGGAVDRAIAAVSPTFAGKRLDRSGMGCTEIGDRLIQAVEQTASAPSGAGVSS